MVLMMNVWQDFLRNTLIIFTIRAVMSYSLYYMKDYKGKDITTSYNIMIV
jgi:hypothetical protein